MAKKKTTLTEAEVLAPLPVLFQPTKNEVVFPDAGARLAAQKKFLNFILLVF